LGCIATEEVRSGPPRRLKKVADGGIAAITQSPRSASSTPQSRPRGATPNTTGTAAKAASTTTKATSTAAKATSTAAKATPLVKLPKSDGGMSGKQRNGKKPDGETAHDGSHYGKQRQRKVWNGTAQPCFGPSDGCPSWFKPILGRKDHWDFWILHFSKKNR
jgi:hypothetical protein